MKKRIKAFTLIELLVTIVIMGVLATISVGTYNNFIKKAEVAKDLAELSQDISKLKVMRLDYQNGGMTSQEIMDADLKVVAKAIAIGRKKAEKTLNEITGYACSDCVCRGESFVPPLSGAAQSCVDNWGVIMDILRSATDVDISFLETDPWGSPYLVDENEGEFSNNYCRKDMLFSAGPNRIHEVTSAGDVDGDDYVIFVDFYNTTQCGN